MASTSKGVARITRRMVYFRGLITMSTSRGTHQHPASFGPFEFAESDAKLVDIHVELARLKASFTDVVTEEIQTGEPADACRELVCVQSTRFVRSHGPVQDQPSAV